MKLAERPPQARPNILMYGPEKAGKTAGACTAPGGILLFNNDLPNATRFARSKRRDPEGRILEPEIAPYVEGTHPVFDLMREIMEAVAKPNQNVVDVVVTDPVGELYRRLLEEVSNRAIKPTFDHRIVVTTYMERFFRFLCEEPSVSAIFICHEMQADRGGDEGLELLPFVGSKTSSMSGLGPKLRSMVDIVAYCGVSVQEDGSKEYGAQLITHAGRRGGDRFACLGDYQPLDLEDWWRLIAASESEDGVNVEPDEPEPVPDPTPASPAASTLTGSTTPSGEQDSSDSGNGSTSSKPASGSRRRGSRAKAAA
jgi:AAA domain-containing protein